MHKDTLALVRRVVHLRQAWTGTTGVLKGNALSQGAAVDLSLRHCDDLLRAIDREAVLLMLQRCSSAALDLQMHALHMLLVVLLLTHLLLYYLLLTRQLKTELDLS